MKLPLTQGKKYVSGSYMVLSFEANRSHAVLLLVPEEHTNEGTCGCVVTKVHNWIMNFRWYTKLGINTIDTVDFVNDV